ncbi:MAG: hypothetical protein ACO2OV_01245 [Thermoproteota archaeon]
MRHRILKILVITLAIIPCGVWCWNLIRCLVTPVCWRACGEIANVICTFLKKC